MCWQMAAAGGILGAVSTVQQSRANRAAIKGQENILNTNAKRQDEAANALSDRAKTAEGEGLVAGEQFMGTQRAGLAASNLKLDSGTPLDILANTAGATSLDARLAGANVEAQAYDQRIGAWNSRSDAAQLKAQRINIKRATHLNTAIAFMGGAANGASIQSSLSKSAPPADSYDGYATHDYRAPSGGRQTQMRGGNSSGSYAGSQRGFA